MITEKTSRETLAKAIYALKKCKLSYGKYVFITGNDAVSIFIGAAAKHIGVMPLYSVEDKVQKQYVESMGFETFLYKSQDLKEMLDKFTSGRHFDAVFETTGNTAMYELFIQVIKRGACAALMKPLPEPFYFHVCDAVRDQINFLGITKCDGESQKIAEQMLKSGVFSDILTKIKQA